MKNSAVLALLAALMLGSAYAARIQSDMHDMRPAVAKHHSKAKLCSDLTDEDDCLHGFKDSDCAWCEGDTMEVCLDAEAAYGIAPRVAKCKGSKAPRKPICSDLRTKGDCLDFAAESNKKGKDAPTCAWCEGHNMASCLDAVAASFVPDASAQCKGAALPKDTKCDDLKEESVCLRGTVDGACAWCAGGYMPNKCMDEQAAKFLPSFVTDCKMAKDDSKKHDDDKPTSCMDIKDEKHCLRGAGDKDCAWCAGGFPGVPSGCQDETTAKFLPSFISDCKTAKDAEVSKKRHHDDDDDTPANCMDIKDEKHCLRGAGDKDCAWCEAGFPGVPSGCQDEMTAKFLPSFVSDCKMAKKKKDEATVEDDMLAKKHDKKHDDKPTSCRDIKDRKACLKGLDSKDAQPGGFGDGTCAWCEGGFMPAGCQDEATAKFLPSFVSECKVGKKHKKADA